VALVNSSSYVAKGYMVTYKAANSSALTVASIAAAGQVSNEAYREHMTEI
jgi:hypothetical protein